MMCVCLKMMAELPTSGHINRDNNENPENSLGYFQRKPFGHKVSFYPGEH